MRLFITGDIHGETERIERFCRMAETTEDDLLIILGDAGFNYYLNKRDEALKESVSSLPITILCIHGNHEERPYNIAGYVKRDFNGGKVWVQERHLRLLFADDGEMYTLNGKKCLCIGGAYSVDKQYRIGRGYPWFSSEQPTDEQKAEIIKKIDSHNWLTDYVFTHTCPYDTRPVHTFLTGIDQSLVDCSMEKWLQEISEKLTFEKWFFGHYHSEWKNEKYEMLFKKISELR